MIIKIIKIKTKILPSGSATLKKKKENKNRTETWNSNKNSNYRRVNEDKKKRQTMHFGGKS